jgi:hypothetical protein
MMTAYDRLKRESEKNIDETKELIKNVFDLGDYSFAEVQFGDFETQASPQCISWPVFLHLHSSEYNIMIGSCFVLGVTSLEELENREVEFHLEHEDTIDLIRSSLSMYLIDEFKKVISPNLKVRIYDVDTEEFID